MAIKRNVGTLDRTIRIVVGIIALLLVSLAFVGPQSNWAYLGLIGILPLITGIIGYCPPYAILGISTCKTKEN